MRRLQGSFGATWGVSLLLWFLLYWLLFARMGYGLCLNHVDSLGSMGNIFFFCTFLLAPWTGWFLFSGVQQTPCWEGWETYQSCRIVCERFQNALVLSDLRGPEPKYWLSSQPSYVSQLSSPTWSCWTPRRSVTPDVEQRQGVLIFIIILAGCWALRI